MMKRITVLLLAISTILCLTSGSSRVQHSPANSLRVPTEKNTLIVYLSRTNNTKAIAEIIHQKVGGTLVALELETPYPTDYRTTVLQVVHENETGYLPPLKTKIDRIEQYDFVFLGFPTWGMRLPPPVKSFLHQYNLKGKVVIPFNTNGGWRRQQFRNRQGTPSAKHDPAGLHDEGRIGDRWTQPRHQRCKGRRSTERS